MRAACPCLRSPVQRVLAGLPLRGLVVAPVCAAAAHAAQNAPGGQVPRCAAWRQPARGGAWWWCAGQHLVCQWRLIIVRGIHWHCLPIAHRQPTMASAFQASDWEHPGLQGKGRRAARAPVRSHATMTSAVLGFLPGAAEQHASARLQSLAGPDWAFCLCASPAAVPTPTWFKAAQEHWDTVRRRPLGAGCCMQAAAAGWP